VLLREVHIAFVQGLGIETHIDVARERINRRLGPALIGGVECLKTLHIQIREFRTNAHELLEVAAAVFFRALGKYGRLRH